MGEGTTWHGRLRRVRRALRAGLYAVLFRLRPVGDAPLPDLKAARRILLVVVNFRLGNTVLATPAVRALCDALPGVALDFLGAPAAEPLLQGFPLRRILVVKRRDLAQPLALLRLVRDLRRTRYDVAIHLSEASTGLGALLTRLSGAPQRVGVAGGDRNFFFTTALAPATATHKVDQLQAFVRALGCAASSDRCVLLEDDERRRAAAWLRDHLGPGPAPIALFVGAREHKGKGWSEDALRGIAAGLRARGHRVLVVLGPEEVERLPELRSALGAVTFAHGLGLRAVAALLAECAAVVTPDSGPMHLAIAAGAPTVGLFRKPNHPRWGPRPPLGAVVFDPAGRDVERTLAAVSHVMRKEAPEERKEALEGSR